MIISKIKKFLLSPEKVIATFLGVGIIIIIYCFYILNVIPIKYLFLNFIHKQIAFSIDLEIKILTMSYRNVFVTNLK